MIKEKKLNKSIELAMIINPIMPKVAKEMLQHVEFATVQTQRLILTNAFQEVVSFCRLHNITPHFSRIMESIISHDCRAAVDFAKFMAARDRAE